MASEDSLLYIDGKVEPAKLAGLLGINVSAVYQDHQKGLFGSTPLIDMTYREAIQIYRRSLVRSVELKLLKEQNEQELRLKKQADAKALQEEKIKAKAGSGTINLDEPDTMHPLMKQKLTQEIRLGRVKEVQHWMKVAEEKKVMLDTNELTFLLEPFIQTIKNVLVSIASEFPETSDKIDNCMSNLAAFGEKIIDLADKDDELFIEEMLDKEIDEPFIELAFLPEE